MAKGDCYQCRFHLVGYSNPSDRCLMSVGQNPVEKLKKGLIGECADFGTEIPFEFAIEFNPGAHRKWDAMTNSEQAAYREEHP